MFPKLWEYVGFCFFRAFMNERIRETKYNSALFLHNFWNPKSTGKYNRLLYRLLYLPKHLIQNKRIM